MIIMINSGNIVGIHYSHFWQLGISLAGTSKIFKFSVRKKCDFEEGINLNLLLVNLPEFFIIFTHLK